MNKFAATFALTLMLLTGLVVGQLYSLSVAQPVSSQAMPNSRAAETAARFYAAVNTILETGDPTELRAVLHPDFIDHAAAAEDSGTARDLETALLALHASFPDLSLQASSTIQSGDLVASSLIAIGSARGDANGIPVETLLTGPGLDLLRVDKGVVLERWPGFALPEPPQIESLAAVEVARLSSGGTLHLERLVFDRSSSRALSKHEGTIIIVESGSVEAHLSIYGEDTHAGAPAVPNSGDHLATGDIVLIPAGSPFSLKTSGQQTASVLQVRIEALSLSDRTTPLTEPQEIAPGVIREPLARGTSMQPHEGPFTLAIHRVTLGPRASIAGHAIGDTEIVWVVEGTIQVDVARGQVGQLMEQGRMVQHSGLVKLPSDQGTTGYEGVEVAYGAAGQLPATILLITLALTG